MTAYQTISRRSIDQLETDIVSLAQSVTAAEYEFLVLLREYDLRQGWKEYHFNHCAEWLNLKCGIKPGTGLEKLRVAHALWDLPLISQAFQKGELSYSKARSMTRLATPENEKALLDYALSATAQQVDDHCKQLRNADRNASSLEVNRIHQRRYLSRSCHGDGSMTIRIEMTQEAGELVMKALEVATAEQASNDQHTVEGASLQARQADALVAIAQAYLAGGSEKSTSSADHYQVVVHVDEAALREDPKQTAKSDLPLESVRRLCCDSGVVAVVEDDKGNPLNVGRKHRVVQPALRRALTSRDKSCRFPGCTHTKWLDAHHVTHWVHGGKTSLGNTLLLCSRHHQLLHEGGFSIKKNFEGDWYFVEARGKTLPDASVYQPTKSVTNPRGGHPPRGGWPPRGLSALSGVSAGSTNSS